MDNLFKKIYQLVTKNGLFYTFIYGFEYLYSKINLLFFLPYRLEKLILKRREQIESGMTVDVARAKTLKYVESMRLKEEPYGRYKYASCQKKPVLYASVYAALARHLYGDIDELSKEQKDEWIKYIKSFQCEDGWFRDPEINCELADSADWWGWRHLTFHAVMALTCLGGVAEPFKFLDSFKENNFIESWFDRNYSVKMNVHLLLYIVTLLQYARDYQNVKWVDSAVHKIISLLDLKQNSKTGCWVAIDGKSDLNEDVKISYHFWTFYFYDKYPIKYLDPAINSILSTQNKFGGFDKSANSSACDDIDSIDPLCRMAKLTDYKKEEIKESLCRVVPWILANMNEDGGSVFKRGQAFEYGHKNMYSYADESNMFATWFRTLSLAYIGKSFPDLWPGQFKWNLEKNPGLQFWYN